MIAESEHVRFGSLADIGERIRNVRFTPESRHVQRPNRCPLGANSGHATTCSAWPPATLAIDPLPSHSFCVLVTFTLPARNRGPSSPKKFSPAVFILPIFLGHLGALGGSNAPISFPETLPLAERCCSGSNARFCCERPNRLRVPNSKHRHTERRDRGQVTCA